MQIRSTRRDIDVRPSQQTGISGDGSPADNLLLALCSLTADRRVCLAPKADLRRLVDAVPPNVPPITARAMEILAGHGARR
jgi:hypothetical protein